MSSVEAEVLGSLSNAVSGYQTDNLAEDIVVNSFIAWAWQYLLAPIASHQVIIFMPLFEADFPSNILQINDLLL